jgi:PIN domain nuclease of toxin-antitoxin system
MKVLLDTHTFLWWDNEPDKLPKVIYDLCQNPENELLLSIVSVWEIQIKAQLGKLTLRTSLAQIVTDQQIQNGITLLPITLPHVFALQNLPPHHRDPFDRLLIAQPQNEEATLLSKDEVFANYAVKVVWE